MLSRLLHAVTLGWFGSARTNNQTEKGQGHLPDALRGVFYMRLSSLKGETVAERDRGEKPIGSQSSSELENRKT